MIIVKTTDSLMSAISIAKAFDVNNICVVALSQVNISPARRPMSDIAANVQEGTWVVVGQGEDINFAQVNEDIASMMSAGYSEDEPDDGTGE